MQTPITMIPYTPVLANETSAATSTPQPFDFQKLLSHLGLSVAGFVGICIAVALVLISGIGFCCWRKMRGGRKKRNKEEVHREVQYAKMDTPFVQQRPLMDGYGQGQQQGYYQGYHHQYHRQ